MARLLSIGAIIGVIALLLYGGNTTSPNEEQTERLEVSGMAETNSATMIETGFSYSPALASKFGLPPDDAMQMQSPLLGAALQIKDGVRGGQICLLHVLFDASADVRLPTDSQMHAIGANAGQFPNAFLTRPETEIRRHIGDVDGMLANKAMFRYGRGELTEAITVGDDSGASYSSMPLDGYHREFVPGVSWLAMSLNCELAAHEDYTHASMFLETSASPSEMILNLHVDPARMVELRIPEALFDGMRESLVAAGDHNVANDPRAAQASRFTIISSE